MLDVDEFHKCTIIATLTQPSIISAFSDIEGIAISNPPWYFLHFLFVHGLPPFWISLYY
jgi:hypothetical protein